MLSDLHTTLHNLHANKTTALSEIEKSISIAKSSRCQHAFIKTMFTEARKVADAPGITKLPLGGLAVSVKDLFDIEGQCTRAGSRALDEYLPAHRDSLAVLRLRRAGGALIGRTNMVEFAYSGVGVNPHFGTPANASAIDTLRIPGGSSSGAAISVATGAAFIGLGSDTGGSIRIPAALNGIVGYKSTAQLVPTDGVIPLSTTLDTVCALTRSVEDAIIAHQILAQRYVRRSMAPLRAYRLAAPCNLMLNDLDHTVQTAWHRTLEIFRKSGVEVVEISLPKMDELEVMQKSGGFSAAESYAWHRNLLALKGNLYDPRVKARIERGASITAAEYIELNNARRQWIRDMETAMHGFDAMLSPTVPIVAPPISEVNPGTERDAVFLKINGLLLRNTSVINMLDGCAISVPCHLPEELPVGLMIWAGSMHDDAILNIAHQTELLLQK